MRVQGILRFTVWVFAFILAVFFLHKALEIHMDFFKNVKVVKAALKEDSETSEVIKPSTYVCGRTKPCPERHFAFKMTSGAANAVGPKICLENTILMSEGKRNTGRGMNIALVDGHSGNLTRTAIFDIYSGDVKELTAFLKTITYGTIVMIASFDDAASKLNDEVKKMIGELGSTNITTIEFRDSWVFVGGKGIRSKSPFEKTRSDSCNLTLQSLPYLLPPT
uniref:Protein FAM3C-like n=1 Tax=Scleropages formosus TaxID=113540 RepID=A0A8C9TCV9_SCLFO